MITRRTFLRRGMLTLAAGAVGGAFYSWRVEPFWVETVERPLPMRHLPPDLVGKSLIQISDLHVGPRVDSAYLIAELEAVRALQPDFVVYTGDFVSYSSVSEIDELRRVLARAPHGRLGTAGILGNHDYGAGWQDSAAAERVATAVADSGIPVLRNQQLTLHGLTIGGIDDYWSPNFNPEALTADLDPSAANLILCHNPDVADLPIWHTYQGWILAGHTHGGQVKPPFLPPPILPVSNQVYAAGEYAVGAGRRLYINRGLGFARQVRFNARPEITRFTLQAA